MKSNLLKPTTGSGRFSRRFDLSCWWVRVSIWLAQSAIIGCAEPIAQSGSPLYAITVHESIEGLKANGLDNNQQAKPCPVCGKIHAAVTPGATNQVASSLESVQQNQVCPVCGQIHPLAQTDGHTNMSPGQISTTDSGAASAAMAKYVYCAKCKIYHPVKTVAPASISPSESGILSWSTNIHVESQSPVKR
jgi:hypothetical protein